MKKYTRHGTVGSGIVETVCTVCSRFASDCLALAPIAGHDYIVPFAVAA